MLKRMIAFARQDAVNIMRDNIGLYMIVAPLLMAVAFSFFIPSVQNAEMTFVLDQSVPGEIQNVFEQHGRVEIQEGEDRLSRRVQRSDDVIGVLQRPSGQFVIVAEGNEQENLVSLTAAVLERGMRPESEIEFVRINTNRDPSRMRETTASMLVLGVILIAGILITFNIIDEKESRAISALAVSPLRMVEYTAARAGMVFITALLLSLMTAVILMGFSVDYLRLVMGVAVSTGLGLIVGLTIGGLTDTQISAIAAVKIVMIGMTGIPLASLFIPSRYLWLLYPFPNYWVFQVFQNVFTAAPYGVGYAMSCLWTWGTSLLLLLLLIPFVGKRLKLR